MPIDVDTPGRIEGLFLRYRDRGDVTALAEVYDLTAVRLLSLATHLCANPSEAEDAVQATFLAALADAHGWHAERPLMPWLLGILTNRVRRQRRDAARQPDATRLRLEGPRDPAALMAEVEFSRAVDEAIEKLPRMYQAALVLRLKHGMDPVDIAHALRRPTGTVRSQLSRGMELLRKTLPAVFAGSVAMWALPTRGLAAVREAVVHAAHDVHTTWFWSSVWPWLRRGLLAASASLLVALVWMSSSPVAAALPRAELSTAPAEPQATLETSNELASATDFGMQSQPTSAWRRRRPASCGCTCTAARCRCRPHRCRSSSWATRRSTSCAGWCSATPRASTARPRGTRRAAPRTNGCARRRPTNTAPPRSARCHPATGCCTCRR